MSRVASAWLLARPLAIILHAPQVDLACSFLSLWPCVVALQVVLLWFSDRADVPGSGGTAERAVTTTGSGAQRPKSGDECSIALEVRLESTNELILHCGTPADGEEEEEGEIGFRYTVGESGPGGVLPGLDTLLKLMRENETSSFKLSGQQMGFLPPSSSPSSPVIAQVLFDYEAAGANDLSLTAGMQVELKDTSDPDWWRGSPCSRPDEDGFFPASFVEKVEDTGAGEAVSGATAAWLQQAQTALQTTQGVARTAAVDSWAEFVAALPAGAAVVGELTLVAIDALTNATPDGGVRFKALDEGSGWRTPSDCDELRVTYELRSADGETVLTSAGGGAEEGEMHILGDGTLIPGLEYAFFKMKAEQQCYVEIKPPYCSREGEGEGEGAAEGEQQQSLTGTITLLSFVQITDLSPAGNCGLLLRDIDRGPDPVAFKSPKAFSDLTLHLTFTVVAPDGKLKPVWSTRRPLGDGLPLEITLDDEAMPFPGIETAVRKGLDGKGMKEGAIAILTATPEFCSELSAAEIYKIPEGATVQTKIELLSFENIPETWDMNADKRLQT
jgi:hypothetical protein